MCFEQRPSHLQKSAITDSEANRIAATFFWGLEELTPPLSHADESLSSVPRSGTGGHRCHVLGACPGGLEMLWWIPGSHCD